ncbi:MAG TPA: peptide chain release factor N(5)-glutamine methyltransferase [Marinagarivorans sp.]
MMISQALKLAARLTEVSDSPRLDAELLLAAASGLNRTYFYTWPEKVLNAEVEAKFLALLARREQGEPIAHITGMREFWSLPLSVNNTTLIPRPDTEVLVEVALQQLAAYPAGAGNCDHPPRILDLGTGTGAIALALASEYPKACITGIDQSAAAVALAQKNAHSLGLAQVKFSIGSWLDETWCEAIKAAGPFDLIVSNPPYIDASDPHLSCGDVRFEPIQALVAPDNGLADIRQIIALACELLKPGASLWLEHGWQQAEAVAALLADAGFRQITTRSDYGGNPRITGGFLL